jgi:transcription initiation factor IIF auxiliary subunit
MIRGLHVDVKNGVYQEVSAIASKMKVFDGGKRSDLEYYLAAGKEYYNDVLPRRQTQSQQLERNEVKTQKVAEVKKAQEVRKTTAQDAARRKAAAPTKPGPSKPPKVTDYLDPSGDEFEEAFAEWDKQLAAKK